MNAINRQKFLAELAKLLTFMYEEDRRYALDMYERMFNIAEGNEQWLIQNLMSPTRQAVIIARSYDAKERKLSVSAEWREDGEENQNGETPPFVLAINKIFDDLFPDDEETEETEESDTDQVSFFDEDETSRKETKKHRMPKAAVLLNQTQEFESVTAEAVEGIDLDSILKEERQEDFWTDRKDTDPDAEAEPDPRVQIVDRAEIYQSGEDTGEDRPAGGTVEAAPEAESNPEPPSHSEAEKAEQHNTTQAEAESAAEEPPKDAAQTGEPPKKRRSIEDLLGFRREKKRSEDPASTPSEPPKALEQTAAAAAQTEPAEPAEKAGEEKTDLSAVEEKLRNLPDQNESADAPAKTVVKAALPETADLRRKEEPTPERTAQEKSAEVLPEEKNHAADNKAAAESDRGAVKSRSAEESKVVADSRPAAQIPQDHGAETKEPFFRLPDNEPVIRKPEPRKREEKEAPVKRVPNVPAMILFFIIAIPSVPVMIAILAILVALCVSLSFGMIALGSILVISAFSGFAVLADILLLLGAAIIALALGLLLLWLGIWLIAEVMAGLIRSIGSLYREWCYKEVPAA